jgi:hypothetical protein
MSKGVQKHCSVLNYIRHADEELYDLIQDLCIGRMFVPKRGSPGITFLRPDKSLLKQIQSMAAGDNPEEAVEAIQSLVLLDNLSSIREFDDKKSDIPTYLRQKLPVMSADGKKVTLKNGAEIHPDPEFEARGDRANISVYLISKSLVPAKTEESDFSNAKVKVAKKKGGADFGDNRVDMFVAVLKSMAGGDTEPAMELLVELHHFLNGKPEQALVASQCSYDAIASLACVLQPYKNGNTYLKDELVNEFRNYMYGTDASATSEFKADMHAFSLSGSVADEYKSLVEAQHPAASAVTDAVVKVSSEVGKLNAIKKLKDFYGRVGGIAGLPAARATYSVDELFAEAELRVMSAILFDNNPRPELGELQNLFEKCNLDKPYMLADPDIVKGSNIGFYFSTVYLITRSDALLYVPGAVAAGVGLDEIFNESKQVNLSRYIGEQRKAQRVKSAEKAGSVGVALKARLKRA